MKKFIRIALEPTTLTHLVCIYCGQFHCQLAIKNGTEEQYAGVHAKCAKLVHAKRNVKGTTT